MPASYELCIRLDINSLFLKQATDKRESRVLKPGTIALECLGRAIDVLLANS